MTSAFEGSGQAVFMSSRAPLFLLLAVSVGCTTTPGSEQVQGSNPIPPPPCRVTLPNGSQPLGRTAACPGRRLTQPRFRGNHGNGKLEVGLPTDGKLLITPEKDGSLGWKFPWLRTVCGRLTITGRRLDAPAGPLRASIPEGYGETGFQASGVYFPSEGCWEITGRAGDSELTFVVEVRVRR